MPIFLSIVKMEICLFERFVMNTTYVKIHSSGWQILEVKVTFQQKHLLSSTSLIKHLRLIHFRAQGFTLTM